MVPTAAAQQHDFLAWAQIISSMVLMAGVPIVFFLIMLRWIGRK
jgi:hypothetical protein